MNEAMNKNILFGAVSFVLLFTSFSFASPVEDAIRTIRQVQIEGEGSTSAASAWKTLAGADPSELPKILAGMKGTDPIVSNWFASAVDVVFQNAIEKNGDATKSLSPSLLGQLQQFVLDATQSGQGRALVYDWLCRVDPSYREQLLPKLLGDPWSDINQKAVQYAIEQTEKLEKASADQENADKTEVIAAYQKILKASRDFDEVRDITRRLAKLGQKVDLAAHLGFIVDWHIVGPFDGTGPESFDHVFPPEEQKSFAFEETYEGKPVPDDESKTPRTLRWVEHHTDNPNGTVDLNKLLCEEKEVIAYAMTYFISDRDQDVELRLITRSGTKTWVNGELVGVFEIYHVGVQFDLYHMKVHLKKGENTILMKVRQNEQTQSWAKDWSYRIRVCTPLGYGVVSEDRE